MATQYYVGFNDSEHVRDAASSGTSGTAASVFEFRMGNGTYVPSQTECIKVLRLIERWIINGGLRGAGAGIPPAV